MRRRRLITCAVLCAVFALAGFLVGRSAAPERVRIEVQEKIVYQDRVVEKRVEVAVASTNARRTLVTIRKPDGTEITRAREVTGSELRSSNASEREAERIVYRDRVETKLVENPRSAWRVGGMVGIDGGNRSPADILREMPLTFGLQLERRLFGPFWLGGWALQTGQLGLNLQAEF